MIVTIDGPSGTGKGTVAKLLAAHMKCLYLDTGAMYRSIAYYLMKNNIAMDDVENIVEALKTFEFDMHFSDDQQKDLFYVNGEDVTGKIRTREVTSNSSAVSALREIREYMVSLQRKLVESHGNEAVVEGRDMGTVVFPKAEKKIYLTADSKVRAQRRLLQQKDKSLILEEIQRDMEKRDRDDSTRDISPLMKAEDAIEVDTSNMNIDEVLQSLISIVHS